MSRSTCWQQHTTKEQFSLTLDVADCRRLPRYSRYMTPGNAATLRRRPALQCIQSQRRQPAIYECYYTLVYRLLKKRHGPEGPWRQGKHELSRR
jgi:hypothetical protein